METLHRENYWDCVLSFEPPCPAYQVWGAVKQRRSRGILRFAAFKIAGTAYLSSISQEDDPTESDKENVPLKSDEVAGESILTVDRREGYCCHSQGLVEEEAVLVPGLDIRMDFLMRGREEERNQDLLAK
jgi:hypothetical protein